MSKLPLKTIFVHFIGYLAVKGLSDLDLWSWVVDLDSRLFKQTKGKGFSFYGTLQTDGVGVSVIKQNFASRKGGRQKKAMVLDEAVPYVDSLVPIEQKCLEGRCVLVDPGRRDLLFCMHEYSEQTQRFSIVTPLARRRMN
ncbi:uncharacterized protein BYT42DRAFT_587334 [Radiomyces spectabilis]|uniref:uncharacterized protein n=1 Tax=Radiomyces spectabilis TaxID=64574 RepID=UPI00221E38AB|nr:uncharacterized protein BYT42DRAFT_587334 [Radiomyces spectabilis]KAI8366642.1 hypothetical protein BYT42DRAFT_587334 [Radiomyces spectabilis]